MNTLERQLAAYIEAYERPTRIALSRRYPLLKQPIIAAHRAATHVKNFFNPRLRYCRQRDFFPHVIDRHQSVLRRTLGNSDPRLQEQKIINLAEAIRQLDGVIIDPGNIFSFWQIVGRPSYRRGYVDGMLLSGSRIIEGAGGGLCQLSNFLYWIFLHTPTEIVERHHHAMDVFPDSGRVLPFGAGATVLYNYVDLKVKNISPVPLQIKLWLTDTHLKGQIVAPEPVSQKYHVREQNHLFIKRNNQYFRYNEIFREVYDREQLSRVEKVVTNFAPVLYDITDDYLQDNQFTVIDFSDAE